MQFAVVYFYTIYYEFKFSYVCDSVISTPTACTHILIYGLLKQE